MVAKVPKARKAAGLIVMRLTEKVDTKPVVVPKAKKERNILLVVLLLLLVKSEVRVKAGARKQRRAKRVKNNETFRTKTDHS